MRSECERIPLVTRAPPSDIGRAPGLWPLDYAWSKTHCPALLEDVAKGCASRRRLVLQGDHESSSGATSLANEVPSSIGP